MKRALTRLVCVLVALGVLSGTGTQAQERAPVAKIVVTRDPVTIRLGSSESERVKRGHYAFVGDRVTTDKDGRAKLYYLESGRVFDVPSSTTVFIEESGPRVLGDLLPSADLNENNLLAMVRWKLQVHQRYVSVRRDNGQELALPSSFTLSATYPKIVWLNVDKGASYLVIVDGQTVAQVTPSGETTRMVAMPSLRPGNHSLEILTNNGGEVRSATSQVHWLSPDEERGIQRELHKLRSVGWGDELLEGILLERHGLDAAAYLLYDDYFANSGDPRLRPVRRENDAHLKLL